MQVKDYLKRIDLFEMVDGGDPSTKAPRLLAALKGTAWSQAADTLEPRDLHNPDGVLIFKSFIRAAFSKYEILEEAEILYEFLERCRRKHDEEHRAFSNRFKAILAKLRRIEVHIPDVLAACVYWKRGARLNEIQRSQVLTSCFNRFNLDAMVEAVCIQYPSVGHAQAHGAHNVAMQDDSSDISSEPDENSDMDGIPAEVCT